MYQSNHRPDIKVVARAVIKGHMKKQDRNWKWKMEREMEAKHTPITGTMFSLQTHEWCALYTLVFYL